MQKLKDKGIERAVQKKKKIIEDHHGGCGNDMSSLNEREDYGTAGVNIVQPCDFDTDDDLLDAQRNHFLKASAVDPANVAQPQPLDEHYNPHGPDSRAPARQRDLRALLVDSDNAPTT